MSETKNVKPATVDEAILNDYESGLNFYQLAEKHLGFNSEEAVARVRAIVENKYQKR